MPLGEAHFPDTQAPFRDVVRRAITKSGGVIWQSVSGVPRLDAAGALIGYPGTAPHATARQPAGGPIGDPATPDPLTRLPNRALLSAPARPAALPPARSRAPLPVPCASPVA